MGDEVSDDPTGSVRKPALDVEADGLDCFATEEVSQIETADDAAVEVSQPAALPAIAAGALDVWRRGQRGEFAKTSVVIVVILGLAVLTNRFVDRRAGPASVSTDVPVQAPRAPAAPPSASAPAQPIAQPAIEPVPAVDSRATPRAAAVPRAVPPATPSPRSPASREGSVSVPAPSPDVSVRPVAPSSAATESPIVAAPVEMRSEPAAEAPRAVAAVIVPPSDRSLIERVLEAYRDAYGRLDAPSAAVVWPHVDTRALSRAFSTLAQQDVQFDSCDYDIAGVRARARCVGEIRYVRRVGDQVPRVRRMSWSFALERVSDRWQIAQVTAE